MKKNNNSVSPLGSDFEEHLEDEIKDPVAAALFINAAMEMNDADYLKVALGRVARAVGISDISKMTELNRESIYKMLKPDGNPGFGNILQILDACGLTLSVVPKENTKPSVEKIDSQGVDASIVNVIRAAIRAEMRSQFVHRKDGAVVAREDVLSSRKLKGLAAETHRLVATKKKAAAPLVRRTTKKR